jgi:hypothetical protein
MNFWELLQNLGVYALMIAGLSFLARTIVLQYFSKDLEKFKSTLTMTAYEHQIRFSRLHEKQAAVIEKTYANAVKLYYASSTFLRRYPAAKEEENQQNIRTLWKAADRFRIHFETHRIYFNAEVSEKIMNLNENLSKAVSVLVSFADGQFLTTDGKIVMSEWSKAMDVMEKEIPPIKATLEDSFRKILGVRIP